MKVNYLLLLLFARIAFAGEYGQNESNGNEIFVFVLVLVAAFLVGYYISKRDAEESMITEMARTIKAMRQDVATVCGIPLEAVPKISLPPDVERLREYPKPELVAELDVQFKPIRDLIKREGAKLPQLLEEAQREYAERPTEAGTKKIQEIAARIAALKRLQSHNLDLYNGR